MRRLGILKILLILTLSQNRLCLADIAIIVNTENPISNTDRATVSNIFLGKVKAFPNGELITLIGQPEAHPINKEFRETVLKKTEPQLHSYWARMLFTGRAKPPRSMEETHEIIKFVSNSSNAIAYIDTNKLKPEEHDSIKVILEIKSK